MDVPRWLLAHGEVAQVGLFLLALPSLLAAERFAPRRAVPPDRGARWRANFGLTGLNLVAFGLIPVSLIGAAEWARAREWGLLNHIALPTLALVAANLLLRGFVSFATHWLMHKVPLLWRVHRVHHLDTDLDATTTVRFHPAEFFLGVVPGVPLVVLCGLTPWVLALYELLDVMVNLFSHSNLHLPRGVERWLRYAVVTPDLHRIHHSTRREETDSNFGAVFPVWDLLFGTFRGTAREGHEVMRLGLDEVRGPQAHGIAWLLRSPVHSRLAEDRHAAAAR